MNINEFLNDLANNASRNYKIEQLTANKDNAVLKEVVRLALDPFTQFYQRKIPEYSYNASRPHYSLQQALTDLDILSSRQVTGNAAITYLADLLGCLDADDAKVIERIIEKDLKCGVSVSTANKVWKNLVDEFPCMLCSGYEEKLVSAIQFPAIVDLKSDGMRFNAIIKDGNVEFRSRNGKELDLKGKLTTEFLHMAQDENVVFDGELMIMFENENQFADRKTGNGILNRANKGTITDEQAALVHAVIWDMIPYDDFIKGVYNVPYEIRRNVVNERIESLLGAKQIHTVYSVIVTSIAEVEAEFQSMLSQGLEGIVLKDPRGIWEDKRVKSQIKYKNILECDLRIVGLQEGTGKYEGMLGAILCESEDGVIKVSVGSGLTDVQRKSITTDVIGKIITVKYNERITNKQGEQSLFLPVVIEIREDKTEADQSKDIK